MYTGVYIYISIYWYIIYIVCIYIIYSLYIYIVRKKCRFLVLKAFALNYTLQNSKLEGHVSTFANKGGSYATCGVPMACTDWWRKAPWEAVPKLAKHGVQFACNTPFGFGDPKRYGTAVSGREIM